MSTKLNQKGKVILKVVVGVGGATQSGWKGEIRNKWNVYNSMTIPNRKTLMLTSRNFFSILTFS